MAADADVSVPEKLRAIDKAVAMIGDHKGRSVSVAFDWDEPAKHWQAIQAQWVPRREPNGDIPKSSIQNINDLSPRGTFNQTDAGFLFTVEGSLIVQSAGQYADVRTAASPSSFSYFHPHVHAVFRLPHLSIRPLP